MLEGLALGTPEGLVQIRREQQTKSLLPFQVIVLEGLCIAIFVKGPQEAEKRVL